MSEDSAPFYNCRTGIKDVIEYRNLGVKNIFFDGFLRRPWIFPTPDELKSGKYKRNGRVSLKG
jgi:hypothetical protein